MRNEQLVTIGNSHLGQTVACSMSRLISISWEDLNSSDSAESNIEAQFTAPSRSTGFHGYSNYTPRPEAWGINE